MTRGPVRITQPLLDVLEAFLAADGEELHGWVIIKNTKRGGPTVYKILERLTEAKWITWRWEDLAAEASRPRRRFYRLTPLGATNALTLLAERRPSTIGSRFRLAFGWSHA